jgi:hypothetical protein
MNQLAQLGIVSAVRDGAPVLRRNVAAQPAQRAMFILRIGAEKLLATNAAQKTVKRDNFSQAFLANRQI